MKRVCFCAVGREQDQLGREDHWGNLLSAKICRQFLEGNAFVVPNICRERRKAFRFELFLYEPSPIVVPSSRHACSV